MKNEKKSTTLTIDKLNKKTLDAINNSNTVKGMLGDLFGVKARAIEEWIEKNDPSLSHPSSLKIYAQYLNISFEQAIN